MTDPIEEFKQDRTSRIIDQGNNKHLQSVANKFMEESVKNMYSYNFSWLGRPIIQYPQDIIALQEIIWKVKPDLIIEAGIARGGSIILYASLLELIGKGEVLGIDIDIREHNKIEIEKHPMFKRVTMLEGSSVSPEILEQVRDIAKDKEQVMVILDSNHTHEHVLQELKLYSPLVTKNSYLVVYDTIIEDLPEDSFPDRPWGRGDNPKTAVWEFLKSNKEFVIDNEIVNKLLVTAGPDGYLKRI